jgi:hypothetical protein
MSMNGNLPQENELQPLAAQTEDQLQHPDEKLIRSLEDLEMAAILKHDTVQLANLMSKQILVQNPENAIVVFAQVISRLKKRKINYSTFERSIEKISFINGITVVMGLETIVPQGDAPNTGKTIKRRFTNIWTKEQEEWRLTVRQATIISISE